jgi:hypothetical protein
VTIEHRGSKKRPFKYEPNNARIDMFAVDPQTLVDAVRFIRGWVYFKRSNLNIPLFAGLIDVARILLGTELTSDGKWRLRRGRQIRLDSAGISTHKWEIYDERRFNLAIYQVMTTGKFSIQAQKRLLASGAEGPRFDFLYPNQQKQSAVQKKDAEVREMSKSAFSEQIITHLFG